MRNRNEYYKFKFIQELYRATNRVGRNIKTRSYHAEVINLSLKDKKMIKKFPVLKCQSRFFGLCKIYTISIPEKDIEDEVKAFQKNMSTALKKEWYITFHTSENAIVVFREKIFVMSCKGIVPVYKKRIDTSHAKDKQRWDDMIQYAKSLGVPDEQCDFLPEDFTKQEY